MKSSSVDDIFTLGSEFKGRSSSFDGFLFLGGVMRPIGVELIFFFTFFFLRYIYQSLITLLALLGNILKNAL